MKENLLCFWLQLFHFLELLLHFPVAGDGGGAQVQQRQMLVIVSEKLVGFPDEWHG